MIRSLDQELLNTMHYRQLYLSEQILTKPVFFYRAYLLFRRQIHIFTVRGLGVFPKFSQF